MVDVDAVDAEAGQRRRARELASTRPHLAASHAGVGGLDARAASLRGDLHALMDDPRQDAFGLLAPPDQGWLCCGVADGLGAYAHSSSGADAALDAGLHALCRQLATDGAVDHRRVVAAAGTAAARRARELTVPRLHVATTLTLAAVRAVPERRGYRCLIIGVGDSPALVLRPEGTWRVVLAAAPNDGPSNLVQAHLPEAPHGVVALCTWIQPGEVLVLATDGFSDPLGDGTSGLGPSLAERWLPRPRGIAAFLVDLTYPGHDDRTVIAVWTRDAPGGGDEGAGP